MLIRLCTGQSPCLLSVGYVITCASLAMYRPISMHIQRRKDTWTYSMNDEGNVPSYIVSLLEASKYSLGLIVVITIRL